MSLASLSMAGQRVTADPAVVVELFTSEGCSSCPPADALLSKYAAESPVKGAAIVPLALHVDYWDRLGWQDVFSTRAFSDRQETYARILQSAEVYTPQMIIDGQAAFVGSDNDQAVAAIKQAAAAQKGKVTIDLTADAKAPADLNATIKLESLPAPAAGDHYTVMLAITEDGIVSEVRRGENAGRQMHHDAVVRRLAAIGDVPAGLDSQSLPAVIHLDKKWKRENLHVVAFVQASKSMQIVGAASVNQFPVAK